MILIALVALVGGFVMATAAAGRRTAAAFPRFVTAHGYDFLVFNLEPLPRLSKLPHVASVSTAVVPFNGNVTCTCGSSLNNNANLSVLDLSPGSLGRVTKLVSGRMPVQSSPHQVLASVSLEQDYGVHVGTVISMPFYRPSQVKAVLAGSNVAPEGPTVAFHVVGIETAESEFQAGQAPAYDIYTTQAFSALRLSGGAQYFVRLRRGSADLPLFTADVNALHPFYTQNQDAIATAVTTAIHPQSVGWWVLAILAGLVGMVVVGQALGRQTAIESAEFPTLTALGMPRRNLVLLSTERNMFVALAGAIGAVVVAWALSPLAPLGEARLAEPSTGFAFDPLIFGLGAFAIVVVVLALAVWPTAHASRVRTGSQRTLEAHPSSIVAKVGDTRAPPSVSIGMRHALERGTDAASIPVGSALAGAVLAVLALCATTVFGASLSHLIATPKLYGDDYQVFLVNNAGTGGNPAREVASLERNPSITGITRGVRQEVSINGVSVFALAAKAVRGPLLLSTVGGQLPNGSNQIALGTTTMRQVGARVGSVVHVTVQLPTGGNRTVPFRVVGSVSFPGQFGLGGLGTGAAFSSTGYLSAVCPPGQSQSSCHSAYLATTKNGAVFVSTVPGRKGQAAIAHVVNANPNNAQRPTTPTSLVNFGQAVNFPLILGVVLALFGIAALMHLLVVSLTRHRREMGILKAIGFVNRQVGAVVRWQATTVGLVGILIGVPLGIVAGRAAWQAFATNLGAVPVAIVPLWELVLLAAAVIIVANVLAIFPALAAERANTAEMFRVK